MALDKKSEKHYKHNKLLKNTGITLLALGNTLGVVEDFKTRKLWLERATLDTVLRVIVC